VRLVTQADFSIVGACGARAASVPAGIPRDHHVLAAAATWFRLGEWCLLSDQRESSDPGSGCVFFLATGITPRPLTKMGSARGATWIGTASAAG
jgi:hypothetical protein